jgi:hypothetical protein
VAHPSRDYPNADLVVPRLLEIQIFKVQRSGYSASYRSFDFHLSSPTKRR